MSKTLIILNPHAASGKAGRLWTQLEPILWDRLGELVIAVTQNPAEVALHLDKAYASGLTRVISIGGDGTNHALVNALARLNEQHPTEPPMVYGMLPIGSGRDWARCVGIPFDLHEAAKWIAEAQPHPTDIGVLTYDDGTLQKQEYFLNIASAGISGEVVQNVNRAPVRRPWTFLQGTVTALLNYQPQRLQVKLDGETWFDSRALIVVVANGSTFGRGMKIAPNAQVDDGWFDVVAIESLSRPRALMALRRVYDGSHLTHPAVRFHRAKHVQITSEPDRLGLDLDGEYARGNDLKFQVKPGLLHLLSRPLVTGF